MAAFRLQFKITKSLLIMKKVLLLMAISAISSWSFAQNETKKIRGLKINSIGIEVGTNRDTYQKMDLETMYDLTQNPALLDRDLNGYESNFYRTTSGGKIGFNLSFTPYSRKTGEYNSAHEIRLGAHYVNSEPLISYYKFGQQGISSSFMYCNMVNEVSLNGAYLFKKSPTIAPWLSFYAGVGASLGSSFNNKMLVMESTITSNDDTSSKYSYESDFYDAKSSFYSRIYAPLGINVTIFNKVQFGFEGTIGSGMQSVYDGKTYLLPVTHGVKGTLAFVF
jgi:hypothetical protein